MCAHPGLEICRLWVQNLVDLWRRENLLSRTGHKRRGWQWLLDIRREALMGGKTPASKKKEHQGLKTLRHGYIQISISNRGHNTPDRWDRWTDHAYGCVSEKKLSR